LTQRGPAHRATSRAFIRKIFCRLRPYFVAVALLSLLLLPFIRGIQAQAPSAQSTHANSARQPQESAVPAVTPAKSVDQAIPLPQIADRAEELDHLLREISSQLISKSELLVSERTTEKQAAEIHRRVMQTRDLLSGTPTPMELEDEQRFWRSQSLEFGQQRRLLTSRAAKLEEQIQTLEAQRPEWVATWTQIRESPGIEALVDRIKQELDKIQTVKSQVQEQLNIVLILQNQVSQRDQQISDVLLRVREARERERSRLLELDSRPLWEGLHPQALEPAFRGSFDRSFTRASEFISTHKLALFNLAIVYLLALFGILKTRGYVARPGQPEVSTEASQVFGRPFSVALLVTLIGAGEYMASAPIGIAFVIYLLLLIPVLRILAPLTEPKLRTLLYALSVFYALDGLHLIVQLPPLFRRALFALMVLTALAVGGWLARPSRVRSLTMPAPNRRIFVIGMRACLALLAVSFAANIIGFVALAQVLGLIVLVGPLVAAALYCGVRVLALILSVLLHTPWARALLDVRADAIERLGIWVLALGAAWLWLRSLLQLFAVYDSVIGIAWNLLRRQIGIGRVHFTPGDAIGVVLVLLVGYALANALTFLLKNLVLPRFRLQRGVPYALSTVTYYLLLLLVVVAALSAAGIELNKFTVLTGAIGVGLGFGLQNIVNNFVSGLILLFERPIHVGDTVEVGGLVGAVRRIGARSSTVVTLQGAEVIVPNSNLLSNQVINWTLSSQWRRVDVPIRVAYGSDPERVIKLLVGVAESHPGVLLERPPAGFFMGFGDSALNFELRFWSAWQDTWFQLQSDVTVAVAKALREAGIEIPFPQQDLHIRSIGASAAESLANDDVRIASSSDLTARGKVR
jgi:potassium-dependent mechanosensitive channel